MDVTKDEALRFLLYAVAGMILIVAFAWRLQVTEMSCQDKEGVLVQSPFWFTCVQPKGK